MARFVGRHRELDILGDELNRIRHTDGDDRPGRCVLVRGRRRVGKSRLIETFADRADVPFLYFTATGASTEVDLAQLRQDATESTLPGRDLLVAANPANWNDALRLLAASLPDDAPSIVVLDELPYLMDGEHAFEGTLQRAWDRYLCRKPVLFILIGSDLSMMEALNDYDRPFHQRGREMVIGPLNPLELSTMLGLPAADAFDAALVTGGLPLICTDWQPGQDLWQFLADSLNNPTSPLLVSAERSLAAEFPGHTQANSVLAAIGSGERTFTNIAKAAGNIGSTPLNRSLATLTDKRIVAAELPLSTQRSTQRRYQITDPYLRFWLRFLGPAMPEIERGRGDVTLDRIRRDWTTWRGRAIEPLIRDALARRLPDNHLPAAPAIGGYWTRGNDVEIDIIGADREPVARQLLFVGSIKWLERSAFDDHDLAALLRHRALLTDDLPPLVAVSRAGVSCGGLDAAYTPVDLIEAWVGRRG
ncbi:MAG TPA: ATP-binding protein [Pseudonocardiaceae bacterium]|nr:ATP-binding protein [Pseudonocardiaceae bacterium]